MQASNVSITYMKHNQSAELAEALERLIHPTDADRKAIAEHDGKFYHLPSREYINRECAVKCHPANIELH